MSKHPNGRCPWLSRWLRAIWTFLASRVYAFRRSLHRYREWRRRPVQVLITGRMRGRRLERTLGQGLRRLEHALGEAWNTEIAVIVQQVITTDHQLAGCYQIGLRPDGVRLTLIRLALEVDGRQLSIDELLAVLAEACIGVATQQQGGSTVLVPVELAPGQPASKNITTLRPDPLVTHPNGVKAAEHVA